MFFLGLPSTIRIAKKEIRFDVVRPSIFNILKLHFICASKNRLSAGVSGFLKVNARRRHWRGIATGIVARSLACEGRRHSRGIATGIVARSLGRCQSKPTKAKA